MTTGKDIKYQITDSGWGLTAFYEGQRLIFSGIFEPAKIRANKLLQIFGQRLTVRSSKQTGMIANVDLYSLFSKDAKRVWNNAYRFARQRKSPIGVEDIFFALIKEKTVKQLFARTRVNTNSAEQFLKNYLQLNTVNPGQSIKKLPFEAFLITLKLHNRQIDSLMLLGALINIVPQDNILQAIFSNVGLTPGKLDLLTVWLLDLDHEFAKGSKNAKLLYCCRQAEALEQHFKYFYDFNAIETALNLSLGQTLKDLEHKKALQLLVKAGLLARGHGQKIISGPLVKEAAGVA